MFLLIVDYYSRYIEIARLTQATSADVINHLRSLFAQHGIPETFVSDNDPQFTSSKFKGFSRSTSFGTNQ